MPTCRTLPNCSWTLVHKANPAFIFRFLRKYKDDETVQAALLNHIDWRISNYASSTSYASLTAEYKQLIEKGLFRFNSLDTQNRPVVYINAHVFNPNEHTTETLYSCIAFCLEVTRKWIHTLNLKGGFVFQTVMVVDIKGFGLGNLGYDTIPMVYELVQKQFPQLIGKVLVLNYSWIHAGIWSLVSNILTAEAKSRLVFLEEEVLVEHIPIENIPLGTNDVTQNSAATAKTLIPHPLNAR
jgi:CRAL/TRIO domain